MESKAVARHIRIAPQKARAVVRLVAGKPVREALALLGHLPNRASVAVSKVIKSAAANAEHNQDLDRDSLVVYRAFVDEGPTWKRFHPRQRGQAFPILKRTSHITVVVRSETKEG